MADRLNHPVKSAQHDNGERSTADVLEAELASTGEPVERIETHVSILLFQGDWAYKVKRPVRFEFVDQSLPAFRERLCRQELTLNRRFAPDVYEDVVEVHDREGRVIDHAVKMRRMPAERQLRTLARNQNPDAPRCLRGVARAAAIFHAAAPRNPDIDRTGDPTFAERLWQRTLDDLAQFVPNVIAPEVLDDIQRSSSRFIAGRTPLFAQRVHERAIVDGHGDLLAADIYCLADGPRILDCLEFDDQLRFGDVLLDVAFLVMDLEHLGRSDLADEFMRAYVEFSGEHHPARLLNFYVAYRALVRAKIACLRVREDPDSNQEALSLLLLTTRHLQAATVTLTVVGGLPGSGKSTVAAQIATRRSAVVLNSDVLRKELTGMVGTSAVNAFNTGIYTPDTTAATYDEILRRAGVALGLGESVVLDATFAARQWRDAAEDLAARTHSDFQQIRCVCPTEVRNARLRQRRHDGSEPSDATVDIATQMERSVDPWPDATDLDTSRPVDKSIAALSVAGLSAAGRWKR